MKTLWLSPIAAAALVAGTGMAVAQMAPSLSEKSGAAPGSVHEQPGTMQAEPGSTPLGRDTLGGKSESMPGETQGRSNATERQKDPSAKDMEQGRKGEMRQGKPMPGETQGRSNASERYKDRSARDMEQGRKEEMRQGKPMQENMDQGRAKAGMNGQKQPQQGAERQGTGQGRSVAVDLSSDQRTRLHDVVTAGNLRRAEHVDFNIAVGTRIPRSVRVYGMPQSIVEIVPQYRGFDYIVVGSNLLIIDPATLEIVYVLPV